MKRTIAFILLFLMLFTMPGMAASYQVEQVLAIAANQLGAPYELRSNAPESFNCVSFVAYCFNQVAPGTITLDGIDADFKKVSSISDLKPGDVVGFRSSKKLKGIRGYHFGIYIGKGYFIHAANKAEGVIVSKLKDYKKRFMGAVRVF